MLYKHKCLLPSTHQKLQVSCTEIYSVFFSSRMKNLFPRPSLIVILIWRSFLQAKLGSLLRRWSHQSLLHVTLNKLQVTPKWLKWTWWDIREQTSHQARASGNNSLSSPDQRVTRGTQVNTTIKCHPIKKRFDPNQAHQRKDRCSKCGDSKHIEGFKCPARKLPVQDLQ